MTPLSVCVFPNLAAETVRRFSWDWPTLCERFAHAAVYPTKKNCPLVLFGEIGDTPSDAKCLRHDANLHALHCVVADIDDEAQRFGMDDARAALQACGVLALIVSTGTVPRYRCIAPLHAPIAPHALTPPANQLNGILAGAMTGESWRPCQSWFVGAVEGVPYRTATTCGIPLDVCTDLPEPIPHRGGESNRKLVPIQPRQRQTLATGDGVVEAWNAAHDVATILRAHGYDVTGNRVRDPSAKERRVNGTLVDRRRRGIISADGCRVIFFSDNDEQKFGRLACDAFDLFAHFEHGGNYRRAIFAAARLLGIEKEPA